MTPVTLASLVVPTGQQRSRNGQGARSAPGLVNHSTSDTPLQTDSPLLEIDQQAARLTRMRRRLVRAANVHLESKGKGRTRPAMVTLTYRTVDGWSPRDLSECLKRVRQWMGRRGYRFRYCWTAELQERGAVHYHVLAWLPQGEDRPPFWDEQGWWTHGTSNAEWARNAVGYMVKYVSKVAGKDRLPCGARMHGSGGFTSEERQSMAHHGRPAWVRELSYIGQRIARRKGGGIVQHFACGLRRVINSPWMLVARGARYLVIARRDAGIPSIRTALEAHQWPTPTPNLQPA